MKGKKRVFVLGAGVSRAIANYPIASELSEKIHAIAMETSEDSFLKVWEVLENIFKRNIDSLGVSGCEHPEPIDIEFLSTIIELNIKKHYEYIEKSTRPAYCSVPYIEGVKYSELERAQRFIKKSLIYLLSPFNSNIKLDEQIGKLFVDYLNKGDTIITFNYDVLMESLLWQQKLWSPKDGYVIGKLPDKYLKLKGIKRNTSIELIKLHGSINWIQREREIEIVLNDLNNQQSLFDGVHISEYYHPDINKVNLETVLVIPSYLKFFNKAYELELLKKSVDVIKDADKIYIIGYSIPDADTTANFLLSQIPGQSKIVIINKGEEVVYKLENKLTKNYGLDIQNMYCNADGVVAWIKNPSKLIKCKSLHNSKKSNRFRDSI